MLGSELDFVPFSAICEWSGFDIRCRPGPQVRERMSNPKAELESLDSLVSFWF
jgi:hypothetical protein